MPTLTPRHPRMDFFVFFSSSWMFHKNDNWKFLEIHQRRHPRLFKTKKAFSLVSRCEAKLVLRDFPNDEELSTCIHVWVARRSRNDYATQSDSSNMLSPSFAKRIKNIFQLARKIWISNMCGNFYSNSSDICISITEKNIYARVLFAELESCYWSRRKSFPSSFLRSDYNSATLLNQ